MDGFAEVLDIRIPVFACVPGVWFLQRADNAKADLVLDGLRGKPPGTSRKTGIFLLPIFVRTLCERRCGIHSGHCPTSRLGRPVGSVSSASVSVARRL